MTYLDCYEPAAGLAPHCSSLRPQAGLAHHAAPRQRLAGTWTEGRILHLCQLQRFTRHQVAETTLALVLNAVGDSLLGGPISDALGLDRDTARELAADRLRARLDLYRQPAVERQ